MAVMRELSESRKLGLSSEGYLGGSIFFAECLFHLTKKFRLLRLPKLLRYRAWSPPEVKCVVSSLPSPLQPRMISLISSNLTLTYIAGTYIAKAILGISLI